MLKIVFVLLIVKVVMWVIVFGFGMLGGVFVLLLMFGVGFGIVLLLVLLGGDLVLWLFVCMVVMFGVMFGVLFIVIVFVFGFMYDINVLLLLFVVMFVVYGFVIIVMKCLIMMEKIVCCGYYIYCEYGVDLLEWYDIGEVMMLVDLFVVIDGIVMFDIVEM